MSKFTTLAKDLRSTIVYIQGAQSANSNASVSGVMFQNYDDDTKLLYNMAEISAVDHYGNSQMNGWGDLRLATAPGNSSNVERMRVMYDGRIGVGTSNPSELFEVSGGNLCIRGEGRGLVFKNADGTVAGAFTNCNGAVGNTADGSVTAAKLANGAVTMPKIDRSGVGVWDVLGSNMYFTTDCNVESGNVGIGTDAPMHKLSVRGNIHCTNYVYADSDIRYKTDVKPIENGLDKVMMMRGYTYRWLNADEDRRRCGVVAQEVEQVLPEAVTRGEGGMLSVAYGHMNALLIEAIRELNQKVDQEITALRAAILTRSAYDP